MERLNRPLLFAVLLVLTSFFSVSCVMDAELLSKMKPEGESVIPSLSQDVILEAVSPLQTNDSPLIVRARFGDDVTSLDLSMFAVQNATLQIVDSELVGPERRYRLELIPDHDGAVSIRYSDSNTLTFLVDTEGPQLQISNPSPLSAVTGASFTWTLTYSDFSAVSLQSSNIVLQRTGSVANCVVSLSTVSASVRTVTVSSCTGSGTVRLQIDPGTAQDAVGNVTSGDLSNVATVTPVAPTGANLMKSVLSGGAASVVEMGMVSGAGSPYASDLSATCLAAWQPTGTLCDDVYSDFVSEVVWGMSIAIPAPLGEPPETPRRWVI